MIRTVLSNQAQQSTKISDFTKGVLSDALADRFQKILKAKISIALPITVKSGKVAGTIMFSLTKDPITTEQMNLFQMFARQLGLAFSNVFAFERLMLTYRKSSDAENSHSNKEKIPSMKFTLRISPRQLKTLEQNVNNKSKTKAELIRDLLDKQDQVVYSPVGQATSNQRGGS